MLNLVKNISAKCYENPAKMLFTTSAIAWGLGSASQVAAIQFNSNLSKKEKDFLIPQEIADGAINIGLFLTFSAGVEKVCRHLIDSGKIEFVGHNKTQYKAPFLTLASIAAGAIASNIVTPFVRNYVGAKFQKSKNDDGVENAKASPKLSIKA